MFARAVAGKPAQLLGKPDVPHSVTYIEDFGRALVTLGEREDALGRVWHVPNAAPVSMRRFVELVFAETGRPPGIQTVPRPILRLLALVNPTLRAVTEQLYQSDRPWIVDSARFEQRFGWTATSLPDSIHATVSWFREQLGRDRGDARASC